MFVSHVPTSTRSRRLLPALVAAALLGSAPPAAAGTVSLKVTDPATDSTGGAALDITGATVAQDTTAGRITATVSFGAAPRAGAALAMTLGNLKGGACAAGDGQGGLAFLVSLESPPSGIWLADGQAAPNAFTPSVSGTTLKMVTGASSALKTLAWNCASVTIQAQVDGNSDPVGDAATGSGTGSGGAQVVVLTDKPDADRDGIPDVADACPSVPGASANGCLTLPARLALRLGAKRVAIDTLVPKTGATCASVAKVAVKEGRKTIGKGTLDVGVHGAFCHISGVVKIKKHGKKVKLKISGPGFKTISTSLKR